MIPEKEPLAGDDYVTYENTNNTAVTILPAGWQPAQTKGSKSTKIICSVFVGCLLVLSIVGTVVYFTVIKDKHQDNPATNTTVAWTTTTTTTTTTAATTPSPWSSWSRCSEECSSSLNPNDLKCPTKRRYRTKQGKREIDTTDCNCVQCPFRYELSGILTDAADHTTVPRFQLAIAKWSHQVEEFYMTQGPRIITTKVSINVKGPGKIHRIHIGTDTAEEIVRDHANIFRSVALENTLQLFTCLFT